MLSDRHKIFAPVPFTLVTLETLGTFLYPNPLDVKLILLIPPVVFFDDVSYVIVDDVPTVYDDSSGTSFNEILNPPVVTLNAT